MKLRCRIRVPSCAPIITASLLGTGIAAGWLGLEGKKESIAGPGGERGHRGYRGHGTPRCTLARTRTHCRRPRHPRRMVPNAVEYV